MSQQRLDMRMNQNLVMTPQLRMAIKLLQMNSMDVQSFVQQELLENPFLQQEEHSTKSDKNTERNEDRDYDGDDMPEDFGKDTGLDVEWDSMYEGTGSSTGASAAPAGGADSADAWERTAAYEETLKTHLNEQLGLSTDDAVTRFLGQFLIDAIDDAGYLSLDLTATAEQLGVEAQKLHETLELIQSFEPTGVGARNLSECLRLQLQARGQLDDVAEVVLDNLDILARHDVARLARLAGCSSEEAQAVCNRITHLTPKPGLKFGSDVSANVVPELVVTRGKDGQWRAELNAEAMPKILVNKGFDIKGRTKDDKAYISEKMNRAEWLLKSLEQRAQTIYKVGNALLELQRGFFEQGVEHLQPLTLKTVAEKVDVHESTVSRVTNGKYMQTPMGVFELKYFFSSAIGTMGGNVEVASESVKAMIKRLIKAEDATKPLSDEAIVKGLKKEGIDVARRTVAKYREALGIPSSSRRRVRV